MSVRSETSYDFDVAVDDADGRAVVWVRGELDIATAPRLRQALADGQDRHRRNGVNVPLVVDLSGVTFMDASGLGVLIGASRRSRRVGGDLVLRNPSPRTMRMLDLTRLVDVFVIAWDSTCYSALPVG